jgi:anti-sigma B factor antagonist
MSISMARHGDTNRIAIGPDLVVGNRDEFKQLVLNELAHGQQKFLVDFRQTRYIDSAGLGALVSLAKKVRAQRGELTLLNLNDELRTLFRRVMLDTMFAIGTDGPPLEGEATAGSLAPLKPRPRGPLHGAAEADIPPSDAAPPP